jgi:hypothetical protein
VVESLAPFFVDFGLAGTLAGVAVVGLLDAEATDEFGTITQRTSFLLRPGAAVTATVGQTLVVAGVTYTVRQVLPEPPDAALQRLVVTRA